MDSLEKKVCLFMGEEYSGKSDKNHSLEDYESENFSDQLQNDPSERTLYWESQEALLQETLERYNLLGCELRQEIGEIMEVVKASEHCSCCKPNYSCGCSYCLRKLVVAMLCDRGYNATLRFSKWENTKKFPGGSHEYIEVISNTQTKKQIPYLIELELRDQFQIARAGEEYKKLVSSLPEFYVGRPEYLTAIIRVMCDAAKRSMKEKKIHMGPWRKSSFMQMKWSGLNKNWTTALPSFPLRQAGETCLRISGAHAVAVT